MSSNGRIGCTRSHKQCALKHIALIAIFLLLSFLLSGCIAKNEVEITLKNPTKTKTTTTSGLNFTVSNVQVINHQIIIAGTNLNNVSNFNIKEGANTTNLQIESQTSTAIVANTLSNVSFAAGKVFDFIFSNANASSSFTINFSLCDSTLGGKGFNCSITPNDKEVLSYDAVSGKWKPRAVNGLSYQGAWDASTALPSTTTAGDYYIVSVAHGAYSVGDWIVFNGTSFDQINNSATITNVFGRTGAVTANKGDYVLTKMGDVDLTTTPPTINQVLKYNGANWVPATVTTTETDPTVMAFAKAALPTCGAGQVLKSDGTSLSCVIDSTGAGAFSGTANRAVVTDATGALAVSAISDTVLGYLSGATSNIQTQLNNKLNSSSFVDWSAAGVQTLDPTRLNLTTANRAVVTSAGGVPTASTITSTELGYLSGVTSAIQTQLNAKISSETDPSVSAFAKTALPTCAAGEVLKSDGTSLSCVTDNAGAGSYTGTQNRVVLTDGATGALTTSSVTNTEVGYVSGVTSAIQTQLNAKQATINSSTALTTGSVQTNLQNAISISPFNTAAGNTGEVRFNELAANGSNYVALKAPDDLTANIAFTLPATTGTNGQVLTTSGATGLLTWSDVATTGTALTGDIGGTISANTIGAGKVTLTHLSATGTKNNTTYLRGDNTWSLLQTDVQAVVLSAYALGSNAVVAATDTVVSAFGKLQKQITALSTSAVGGDLTGNLPNPTVAKIQGTAVSTTAPLSGQFFNFNGTNWAGKNIVATDLKSSVAGNLFPGTGCSVNQTLQYSIGTDAFSCVNIDSLDAAKITTGTIAAARLPASATYWDAATGGINYAGGNVGIGTTAPVYAYDKVVHLYGLNPAYKVESSGATGYAYTIFKTPSGTWSTGTVGTDNSWRLGTGDGLAAPVLTALSTGNVGIGTTTPAYNLDVSTAGNTGLRVQGTGATGNADVYLDRGATNRASRINFTTAASADWSLGTMYNGGAANSLFSISSGAGLIGNSKLVVDSTGNVGIGTTTPSFALDVKEANSNAQIKFGRTTASVGSGAIGANDANALMVHGFNGLDVIQQNLLVVQQTGNVGIGTTSPGYKLDVQGVGNFWAGGGHDIQLNPSGASLFQRNVGSTTDTILQIGNGSADTATFKANGNVYMSGNVGIGTTAPNNKLHVAIDNAPQLLLSRASGDYGLQIKAYSNIYFNTKLIDNSTWQTFMQACEGCSSGNSHLILQPTAGNVGIGTTTPGFTLDVNGLVASTGAMQSHSDKRLKKNIAKVDHSLEKLLALNGVYFDWRKDEFPQIHFEGGRQMGVIAQDVEKVFPEAVAKNKEGIRSVAYTMLIAPMIEALKELNKRVTELFKASEGHSREIASVKGEVAQVNDRATKLEAKSARLEAENAQIKTENAKLKTRADKAEQENVAKAKELETMKARLDKIEKALNSQ